MPSIAAEREEARLISEIREDEKEQDVFYAPRKTWIPLSNLGLVAILAIVALLGMLIFDLGLHFVSISTGRHKPGTSNSLPGAIFGSCGDMPASAREADCIFDIMSFSWLPRPCAEPELTAEFLKLQNWTWWLQEDKKEAVPYDEVTRGEHKQLFVTREYHMYHCTYMWRKLHLGMLRGQNGTEGRGIVDTYIGDFGHTKHCEMMLLGEMDDGGVVDKTVTDTAIVMKFPQCMWT